MYVNAERFDRGFVFQKGAVISEDDGHLLTVIGLLTRALEDLVEQDDKIGHLLLRDTKSLLAKRGVKDAVS